MSNQNFSTALPFDIRDFHRHESTTPCYRTPHRNLPDRYLARIRNLTFLIKHKAMPIKATWTWSAPAQTWQTEVNKDCSFSHEDKTTLAEVDKIRQALLRANFHRAFWVTKATAKGEDFLSQPFTAGTIRAVMAALWALENAANRSVLVNVTTGSMAPQGLAMTSSRFRQLATLGQRLRSRNSRSGVSRLGDSETASRLQ